MNFELLRALENIGPHDHLCSIYETPEEHFAVAVPFIRIGLERREQCIYIADDGTVPEVLERMRQGGIDVDAAQGSGALRVTTKEHAYLAQGHFDPEWMFTFWREAADQAAAGGFRSLRATGETEWVVRGAPGLERWMEYESRLTRTLEEANAFALCQYNRRALPPEIILDVIRTHPTVIYGDTVCRNFYYVPAEEFLGAKPAADEVSRLLKNIRDRERIELELRRSQEQLESRVRERTAELERQIRETQAREQQIETLNRELQQNVAELTAVNKELEAFTYSVSHDLRAPLRHIEGFAQILGEELGSEAAPPVVTALARIREGAQQMGRMVEDLLALSKTNKHELRRELTGIRSLAEQVLAGLEAEYLGRDIRFEIGPLPFVDCDAELVKQALANLVSNAIKFTRPRHPAIVEIGQTTRDGVPAVYVRDNGVGFSMKYAGRLFGVFQRLHRHEDFEGSGVGLAIVQRIVHKHGGRVWAEAELNKGAAFFFTLAPAAGQACASSGR